MIGIIGAMEEEVELLGNAMASTRATRRGGFTFLSGVLDGKEVVLLRCGIGKVNAAVGCALLIDRFSPDLVINTGSAGGLAGGLSVGDVVIARSLIHHDVDVTAFDYAPGQVPGQPERFEVRPALLGLAESSIEALKSRGVLPSSLRHLRGTIGSGDIFVHEGAAVASIRERFPDLSAVEMESAAIAQTCSLFEVDVLVIRALSDVAGVESPVSFEEFLPLASRHSAEIVREIVKER